jgi:hypothetical protein
MRSRERSLRQLCRLAHRAHGAIVQQLGRHPRAAGAPARPAAIDATDESTTSVGDQQLAAIASGSGKLIWEALKYVERGEQTGNVVAKPVRCKRPAG